MTRSHALDMRNIHKAYHGNPVLRGVDFSVRRGSVHALLGANGAGKSTLMKIATGTVRPDIGRLFVGDREVQPGHAQGMHRAGLGMVYQDLSLIETLTVSANVFLGRTPAEGQRRRAYIQRRVEVERSESLFRRIGVSVDPEAEVRDLTLPDRQIVEIAKALVVAKRCLVLDEPTTALSAREIERLFRVIAQLRDEGMGVIFITHHLQEVFQACDEVTVLRDGSISYRGRPEDTSTSELVRAMVARDLPTTVSPADQIDSFEGDPLMAVRHLSVRDRLHDVSFDLRPGEVLGVAGLAGSGSNELIRSLAGIEAGSTGRVDIHGSEARILTNPRRAISSGLYLIPGSRKTEGLVMGASIQDNVVVSALREHTTCGVLRFRRIRALVSRAMTSLQIKARARSQDVDELSGGNQQKVVLAKALATNAEVFLLEEPTFGVDIQASFEISDAIRALVDKGRSCLWLTTDLWELARVSDRILHIEEGVLVGTINNQARQMTEGRLLELIHSTGSQAGTSDGDPVRGGPQRKRTS